MYYLIRISAAIAALLVCSSSTSRAVSVGDAVMEWNQIAVARTLNATPAQAPVQQTRTMAIVQVSVHDAINGITGRYETYSSPGPAPANASPVAAAIAAAHHALRALFPGQVSEASLDASYATSLSTHGVSTMTLDSTSADPSPRESCCCGRTTMRRTRRSTTRCRAPEPPAYGSAWEVRRRCCPAGEP
jgi:hypothetical protein